MQDSFSSVWDLVKPILRDGKLITSAVVAAVGTAGSVIGSVNAITQDRSIQGKVKLKTARVGELIDLVKKLPPDETFAACRRELEAQISEMLRELDALRKRASRKDENPHQDLTLLQRLFLLFCPLDQGAWIIHSFAYLFMAAGPLILVLWVLTTPEEIVHTDNFRDTLLLVVYCSVAFRLWALARRKWTLRSMNRLTDGIHPQGSENGLLSAVFVLKQPVHLRMLVAQICMWCCLFCTTESFGDILLHATHRSPENPKISLFLFVSGLFGTAVCRAWASAESRRSHPDQDFNWERILFPASKLEVVKGYLITPTYAAAIVLPLLNFKFSFVPFSEVLDRIEFSFIWLAVAVACNGLLSYSQSAGTKNEQDAALATAA